MAQKVSVLLVDDLDESEATETVLFALDGSQYEIDLNGEHAAQLREAFATYVGSARRAGGPPARRRTRSTASAAPGAGGAGGAGSAGVQQIRDWARANGHQVSDRGRLSAAVVQAYEAAHS